MQGEGKQAEMESASLARATPGGADYKRSDNGGGNRFSKYNKKREGSGGGRQRNDPPPRKQGSKTRGYTKRPQPRSYANSTPRTQITEAQEAEFGSALQTGSKKANLNHLLNFTLAPREGAGGRGTSWKNRNNWGGKRFIKYNKEQFLQANCQFVVPDIGDYTVNAADPDMLVEWDCIQQVRIQSHEVPNCPICLFPPVAAKMTRCGHIYCWTCMLHYLALGEKSWRKCPICYEAVHKKDLKSVVAMKTRPYTVGDAVTMVLMKRERGSTYAMPKSQWQAREAKPHAVDDEVDTRFVKLLTASIDHVQQIIDEEKREIMQQIQEEDSTESIEGSFTKAALELLKEREDRLHITADVRNEMKSLFNTGEQSKSRNSSAASLGSLGYSDGGLESSPTVTTLNRTADVYYSSAFDDEMLDSIDWPGSPEDSGINIIDVDDSVTEESSITESECLEGAESVSIAAIEGMTLDEESTPAKQNNSQFKKDRSMCKMTSVYYFYQAEDGQHIYLNSLNARCLIKEYGSLENSPESITANIVDIESISMTEDLRRKRKYLSHLPLTCEFQVAELALKPPIISGGTIAAFAGEIEQRRKMRQKKARQEKRADKRMKHEQDPALRAPLTSARHFPACGTQAAAGQAERPVSPSSDVSTPLGSPPAVNLNPFALEFTPGSPYTPSSLDNGNQTATVSFAQMLRDGQRKPPEAWPKTSVSGNEPKVVHAKKPAGSDESDSEDRVPIPQFQHSFGNAIQQALDNYSNNADASMEEKGRKKKKKQKKLLFTTTMARK